MKKEQSLLKNIQKYWRYICSGYIFRHHYYVKQLNKKNYFVPKVPKCKQDLKIVVYTVNTGKYDNIQIFKYDKNIDYVIFTDLEIESEFWEKRKIPNEIKQLDSLSQARYIKLHPHLLFPDYQYSVFIDGNIKILKDIKPLLYSMIYCNKVIASHIHQSRDCIYDEARVVYAQNRAKRKDIIKQINHYREERFPKHYGLFETNVLIRKHTDSKCIKIMDTWWNEIKNYTKRDQLSFTYALWKNGYTCEEVFSLGNNSRNSDFFLVVSHK